EAEWQAKDAAAKEAGARRKPPRPAPPTAAEIRIAAPFVGEGAVAEGETEPVHQLTASQIAEEMAALAREGEDVIRLVAGNPLSNQAVMLELQEVANLGVDFQVVPGMTGSVAVPAFTGIGVGSRSEEHTSEL